MHRQLLTPEEAVALIEPFNADVKMAYQETNQQLAHPLSERELEVLTLIAAGLTNQEVADQLFVGSSTVKKHINHIYSKLDVTHRTQAVAAARALKILP
jgi:ATP/maltotriose-dependent transcriptional regulator MalT